MAKQTDTQTKVLDLEAALMQQSHYIPAAVAEKLADLKASVGIAAPVEAAEAPIDAPVPVEPSESVGAMAFKSKRDQT